MLIIRGLVLTLSFLLFSAIVFFCLPARNVFLWHPILMCSGFLLAMLNGIHTLSRDSFAFLTSKSERIKAHWIFESLAALLLFLGFIAIYANKVLNGKPHFTTWHGLLGLFTVIYCISQLLFGFVFHWNYNLWRSVLTYSTARFLHAVSGTVLYCSVSLTFILGFYTNWFQSNITLLFGSNSTTVLYSCLLIVCLGAFSVFLQIVVKYNNFIQLKLSTSRT
uniref:ascorbate ferrireductase (transmembrane) n=1 Tax=Trichobilharzia regenti TaxID=157069 RepID=A0AA85IRD6_TRIRE|nr:unnamed protein product [Trichobilharzia regenti]